MKMSKKREAQGTTKYVLIVVVVLVVVAAAAYFVMNNSNTSTGGNFTASATVEWDNTEKELVFTDLSITPSPAQGVEAIVYGANGEEIERFEYGIRLESGEKTELYLGQVNGQTPTGVDLIYEGTTVSLTVE